MHTRGVAYQVAAGGLYTRVQGLTIAGADIVAGANVAGADIVAGADNIVAGAIAEILAVDHGTLLVGKTIGKGPRRLIQTD